MSFDFFSYLNEVHGHEPQKVLVFGELLQVLSNSDGLLCVCKRSIPNTQPKTERRMIMRFEDEIYGDMFQSF